MRLFRSYLPRSHHAPLAITLCLNPHLLNPHMLNPHMLNPHLLNPQPSPLSLPPYTLSLLSSLTL